MNRVADGTELRVADNPDYVDIGVDVIGDGLCSDRLADCIGRTSKAEIPGRQFVDDDVDAAGSHGVLHRRIGWKRQGLIIHRPVAVEPATGLQGQAHGIEETMIDLVIANVDGRCGTGRYDAR